MTKQTEDTLFEVYTKVSEEGIRKEFDQQLSKMDKQDKHRWMTIGDRYEYAYSKVKKSR